MFCDLVCKTFSDLSKIFLFLPQHFYVVSILIIFNNLRKTVQFIAEVFEVNKYLSIDNILMRIGILLKYLSVFRRSSQ